MVKGEYDLALDYASRSLTMLEEIDNQTGLATNLRLLGSISFYKGELNQTIEYCKKSLSSKMISTQDKLLCMDQLGQVYGTRGEIDKALKYYKKGFAIAERDNVYDLYVTFQAKIGSIYFQKGEDDLALEFLEPSLSLAEKTNNAMAIIASLIALVQINHNKGAHEEVQKYLERLNKLQAHGNSKMLIYLYQLLNAAFLMKKAGSSNRAEAERLLKKISSDATNPNIITNSLIYLCEFYLEELNLFEDPAVLKKIDPLIEQYIK